MVFLWLNSPEPKQRAGLVNREAPNISLIGWRLILTHPWKTSASTWNDSAARHAHFALVLLGLPLHHRDPFDRLLIAQALTEKVSIVSDDAKLDAYGVTRLW